MGLSQNVARDVNVVDGGDDLADLLVVCILALNLILKVLLEGLILHLDVLDLTLQSRHSLLALVKVFSHFCQGVPLVLLHLLHPSIYH